jgi:hypothetical protein
LYTGLWIGLDAALLGGAGITTTIAASGGFFVYAAAAGIVGIVGAALVGTGYLLYKANWKR